MRQNVISHLSTQLERSDCCHLSEVFGSNHASLPTISSIGANHWNETATNQKDIPQNKAYEMIESHFIIVRRLQDPAVDAEEGGIWHDLSLRVRIPANAVMRKIDCTALLSFNSDCAACSLMVRRMTVGDVSATVVLPVASS